MFYIQAFSENSGLISAYYAENRAAIFVRAGCAAQQAISLEARAALQVN